MDIVPGIYEKDGEVREGAMLAINNTANAAMLRDLDVESICGILDSFSFQAETLLLLNAYEQPHFWTDKAKRFDD